MSPFCARPKRSHYKAVTSQIPQKTRVLWLTRGFPEEKLLWSDSWAQDCKREGQDSHNESMCVLFLKRKRIKERSGLIWTVFDSVRIRFDPHYRAASRKSRSIWMCVNICNYCHCWISSTSSSYRNSRLKIEIKKVFNIWSTKLLLYASVHYYLNASKIYNA